MEKWQKQVILDNLGQLIQNVECSTQLVSYLQQFNILFDTEINTLDSKEGREAEKTFCLLQILQERMEGFKHLAKALHTCNQLDAFNILLSGIRKQAMSTDVLFEGVKLPLQKICLPIGTERLQNIIETDLDQTTYEQWLGSEPWKLAIETVPTKIPYYISRNLSINAEIDPVILERYDFEFYCIEGLEFDQLSNIISSKRTDFNSSRFPTPEKSSNQIEHLTAKFILLERHSHFQQIANQTEKSVVWIKYDQGKYYYVRSANEKKGFERRERIRRYFTENPQKFSEDEFVERCLDWPRNLPVLIFDSPGNGKSVLLAELARKLKERRPESSVIYFSFSELIGKMGNEDGHVKQSILGNLSSNKLRWNILQNLWESEGHQIELFLDGFDELHENHLDAVHDILDWICEDCRNIRVFITARPDMRNELEQKFGVIGFNIVPFDESNKLSLFLKYWKSVHGVEPSQEITQFAEHCLKSLSESEIAGVPHQCKMLAEIYATDAKLCEFIPTQSDFQMDSIFQVYRKYVDVLFGRVSNENTDKKLLRDFHAIEAIRTLFPADSEVLISPNYSLENETIHKIGIMQPSKSDPNALEFNHRTVAEFLAADFIATLATTGSSEELSEIGFIDLLFGQVFQQFHDKVHNENVFKYPVIIQFLNYFLSTRHSVGRDSRSFKIALRENDYYNHHTFLGSLFAALRVDAFYLFRYILDFYLDLQEPTGNSSTLVTFRECLRDPETWQGKPKQKLEFLTDRKYIHFLTGLIPIAAKYSSLELVKLTCEFFEALTGKQFHEIRYDSWRWHPTVEVCDRGHFGIFTYFLNFDKETFYEQPLLFWCLRQSLGKSPEAIKAKVQIVQSILQERPDLVNKKANLNVPMFPLVAWNVHFELVKCLIEAGVDLTVKDLINRNIAHLTAHYISADEFHQLVTWAVERNAGKIYKEWDHLGCNPVHTALQRIELRTETLQLLAERCEIDFNDNFPKCGSELAVAIQYRSERVINDVKRFGGDPEKQRSEEYKKDKNHYGVVMGEIRARMREAESESV